MSNTNAGPAFTVPVLVSEDTVYGGNRIDHAKAILLFGRPAKASPASNSVALFTPKRPNPSLFFDTFTSVYPVIEAYSPQGVNYAVNPPQPLVMYWPRERNPELPEDEYKRFNHSSFFLYQNLSLPVLGSFSFDVPSLTDDPWLEQVHRPLSPEALLFPFRQFAAQAPPSGFTPRHLLFWSSKNWDIKAEEDVRVPNYSNGLFFQRPQVYTPPVLGPYVQVVEAGYYGGIYRNIGDVFQLANVADLASSLVNFYPPITGDSPYYGWQKPVAGVPTVIIAYDSLVSAPRTKPRRTVF